MNMNVSKTNGVKLFALIAVLAMVFACAAVVVSDNGVDAANDTQNWGGQTLKGTQPFNGVNINVNENLTIDGGTLSITDGNFTVAKGVTITVKNGGSIVVDGGLVTIDGTVKVTGKSADKSSSFIITGTDVSDGNIPTFKDTGVVVNGSLSFEKGATFEGKKESAEVGQILVKNGANLEVSGNETSIKNMTVYVAVGGTFAFSGKIAESESMIVSSYGTGEHFTLAQAKIETNAASKSKNLSDLTFTTTSKNLNGYLAAAEPQATLIKEFALNVNGSIDNLDIVTLTGKLYKSTTEQNTTTYGPDTTTYYASVDAAKHANEASGTTSVAYNDLVMGKAIIDSLTVKEGAGLNIGTATDKVYVLVSGDISVKEVSVKDYKALGGTTSLTNPTDSEIEPLVGIYDGSVAEVVGTITANYGSIKANTGAVDTLGTIAVNGGTITLEDFSDKVVASFFGAYYTDKDDTAYIADLVTTIDAAVAAGEDEVTMYAATNSEKDTNGYGGYTISANLTIPDGITLNINNALIVEEGVTLTFAKDSEPTLGSYGKIFVNGTVVDNSTYLADEESKMYFQVKIVDEDTEVNTYTSLENALSTTTSGTIYLYNDVTVKGTMTIPENVTVMYDASVSGKKISFEDDNATLVINGTLYLKAVNELDNTKGTVTVNNILASSAQITPNTNFTKINGVYYQATLVGDDDDPEYVITSAAVAATNSANVSGDMVVYGKVAMGTVTFTQGEDYQLSIVIMNSYNGGDSTPVNMNVTTGDITLVGAEFDMTKGAFTGTVTSAVTSGTSTFTFTASKGAVVTFETEETMEGTSTVMVLTTDATNNTSGTVIGKVALTAGQATVDGTVKFFSATNNGEINKNTLGILSVSSGATLDIDGVVTLAAPGTIESMMASKDISETITDNMTFEVAGTVNVNGTLNDGYTVITGTLNVLEKSTVGLTMVLNDGTIAVADDAPKAGIEVMVLNGTATGALGIDAINDSTIGGVYLVMPGSDISGAEIEWDPVNNQTSAKVTEMYINGQLYASVYTVGNIPLKNVAMSAAVNGVDKGEPFEYYADAAQNDQITVSDSTNIGEYETVYVVMQIATANGVVSQGTGLALYIDNIAFAPVSLNDGSNNYSLSVGSHTVRFDVKAGYDGANATITFNGQTVENGGTIEITADMVKDGFTLVANGAAPMDYAGGSSGDSGMGLTEILLVILVILIVVMAIMVALRLMRS